jgi:predicted MPP superfamily phosphohydrolase
MVTLGTKEALPYTEMLKSLKAEYGVASVMGNHDFLIYGNRFGSDTKAHKNAVEEFARYQIETLGWHLLRNSNMIIKAENEKIKNTIDNTVTILGVDNKSCTNQGFRSTNTGDLKAAMRGTQGFRILLSHDPTHWAAEVVPDTDIPLTLSGHTHCAQINILGFTPASWAFEHTRGLYTQDGQTLYINIGLGCTAPFRIGARPEITVITLKSQQSQLHPQQTDL